MKMQLIDLSHKIEPWSKNPYQQYVGRVMIDTFHSYETDGYFDCAIYMGDHTGTHLESSIHFKKNGTPIDKTPLSDYYGNAAVLNSTHKQGRVEITSTEIENVAHSEGIDLTQTKIVLVRTDMSQLWGTPEYHSNDRPSITVEAHEWLLKQGVKIIGADMLVTERDHLGTSPSIKPTDRERWPAHCLMDKYDFCILENLTNLAKIHSPTFTFIGFPLNIAGSGASPIRAAALTN